VNDTIPPSVPMAACVNHSEDAGWAMAEQRYTPYTAGTHQSRSACLPPKLRNAPCIKHTEKNTLLSSRACTPGVEGSKVGLNSIIRNLRYHYPP